MITSDHNPIDIEHKKVEFSEAKDGVIGLETLFGAVNSVLDLETVIQALTVNSKSIFGLKNHSIKEGNLADITLFNPNKEFVYSKDKIISTSKNSPFINKKLKGEVYGIFANNQLILK